MSSKFSSPFFKKSPLQGAYASGADAMVTTSVAPYFNKLQQDIGTAVSKSLMKPVDKCAQGAEYYFDKDGAKFACSERDTENNDDDNSETTNESLVARGKKAAQSLIDGATYEGSQGQEEDFNPNIPIKGKKPKPKVKINIG